MPVLSSGQPLQRSYDSLVSLWVPLQIDHSLILRSFLIFPSLKVLVIIQYFHFILSLSSNIAFSFFLLLCLHFLFGASASPIVVFLLFHFLFFLFIHLFPAWTFRSRHLDDAVGVARVFKPQADGGSRPSFLNVQCFEHYIRRLESQFIASMCLAVDRKVIYSFHNGHMHESAVGAWIKLWPYRRWRGYTDLLFHYTQLDSSYTCVSKRWNTSVSVN